MRALGPIDQAFLWLERRQQPMHVGGLQLFIPREGQTAGELADEVIAAFTSKDLEISEIFRRRPAQPFSLLGSVAWSVDDTVDLDYHVRRIALPKPGRIRELFHYVSLNHSTLLDRSKPMWEAHIIEGLADGRLAMDDLGKPDAQPMDKHQYEATRQGSLRTAG